MVLSRETCPRCGRTLDSRVPQRCGVCHWRSPEKAECLAWVGLRRVLVRERAEGSIASQRAFDQMLHRSYEVWVHKEPACQGTIEVAGLTASPKCRSCGRGCRVRAPAGFLNEAAPQVGPPVLAGRGWRESFGDVGRWARSEVERLEPLLGTDPAFRLVRCQLAQAAQAGRLPSDALEDLLSRATPHGDAR